MSYPSIRIEGAILSPDILSQIEELPGQKPVDFGLNSGAKVKDEIARAWADAQDYWRIFQRKLDAVKPGSTATTETRNLWVVPLLGLLRYDIEYQPRGTELNGRIYAISHRAANRAGTAVQIIGYRDPAGLDKKPANATRRMSAHALVQEFLNLHEQLYGLVSDGHVLRLLRDSSRLVKQSYLEFDLDRIFTDGLYADFAVFYRLLHATRLPLTGDTAAVSLIERYHQDSLDSGARIREGLSTAVERAILDFGNGFVSHPDNDDLRAAITGCKLNADSYYQQLLRLIYRLLFLMVIEERDLVFPPDTPKARRDIYRSFYSVARLRRLSEKRYLADARRHDLWQALQAGFGLFEADGPGQKLGIAPLAGDLFSEEATEALRGCSLGNDVLLKCLRSLGLYRHPDSGQTIRVNYAALNVEEFGSVYEGLLEYEPEFVFEGRSTRFAFRQGNARSATGSHYTPDELVQPLIRHSLDHLIAECLKVDDPEVALLDLRVADIACGSGHILLAAARRIATELAVVRTGEEQPSPPAYRTALRDTIRSCIYGVDLNPLAVELCKVALWLEAHIPGQPLNFLDHHIKCGNAIVGFARREEVAGGVPTEAFKALPGDDKDTASVFRKKNKEDLNHRSQAVLDFTPQMQGHLDELLKRWQNLAAMPELTPMEVGEKKAGYADFASGEDMAMLRTVADIPVAQFYIPKLRANAARIITDADFRAFWQGDRSPHGPGIQAARAMAEDGHFFHWFLEFPEVMGRGGFDCILGNPPYLGGQALSGTYGHAFCECMKWRYAPTGLSDLVVYFLRRVHGLLRGNGFTAIITTNSIVDGDVRKDGIEQVLASGAEINMAVRGMKWPGAANLVVSLLAIHKGKWCGPKMLDGQAVQYINAYFEADMESSDPVLVHESSGNMLQGSEFLGDGFLLSREEAQQIIAEDGASSLVIVQTLNGDEANSSPEICGDRWIIYFRDWPLERARNFERALHVVEERVKPLRHLQNDERARRYWWQFKRPTTEIYARIEGLERCFVTPVTTKHLSFAAVRTNQVFLKTLKVFTTDRWDLFAVVQSTIHEVWARKYSGSLETRLRYSPSDCYDTFAFPSGLWQAAEPALAEIGERYHAFRMALMKSLWLGLTKNYNLFHAANLSADMVAQVAKKDVSTPVAGYEAILELRRLHVEMDLIVRDAYGWRDLDLGHGFHEVETLPENDRVRYTISPAARREVLARLLDENQRRASEADNSLATSAQTKQTRGKRKSPHVGSSLFPEAK